MFLHCTVVQHPAPGLRRTRKDSITPSQPRAHDPRSPLRRRPSSVRVEARGMWALTRTQSCSERPSDHGGGGPSPSRRSSCPADGHRPQAGMSSTDSHLRPRAWTTDPMRDTVEATTFKRRWRRWETRSRKVSSVCRARTVGLWWPTSRRTAGGTHGWSRTWPRLSRTRSSAPRPQQGERWRRERRFRTPASPPTPQRAGRI